MNNSGSGAASGTTFNGSVAQTISYNTIGAQQALTLTTTGTSGAATLSAGALNIPQYAGGVSSVSNSDGTLIISPTFGAAVASLNLAHANTWTATQTFSNIIDSALTAGTSPICPNGTGGAFTTSGCSGGSTFSVNSTPALYAADTGSVNNPSVNLSPALTSLVPGVTLNFIPAFTNTASYVSLTVNSLSGARIFKFGNVPLTVGDISTATIATVKYDGTNWQLQNPQNLVSGISASPVTTQTISAPSGVVPLQLACVNGSSSNCFTVDAAGLTPGLGTSIRVYTNGEVGLSSAIYIPFETSELCDTSSCNQNYLTFSGGGVNNLVLNSYNGALIQANDGPINLTGGRYNDGRGTKIIVTNGNLSATDDIAGNAFTDYDVFYYGTISSTGDIVAIGTGGNHFEVNDCATSCTNGVGIFSSVSNTNAFVQTKGVATVNLDASSTVAVGDFICSSTTTAGKGHANGSVACTTQRIGYVGVAATSVSTASVYLKIQ
jgi:hypothetical protein